MKNILPLCDPPLKYNQIETNVFSIVLADEAVWDWLYNNLIHIAFSKTGKWGVFLSNEDSWLHSPFLYYQTFSRAFIGLQYDQFIQFVIRAIDMENYFFLNIDTFYIPNYDSTEHRGHCIFLFGYDTDNNTFHIADFFSGKYDRQECSFEEFYKAYIHFSLSENQVFDNVVLLSRRRGHIYDKSYALNPQMIKKSLIDYLDAKYPYNKYKEFEMPQMAERYYGIAIYNILISLANDYKDTRDRINPMLFALNYEHKRIMRKRVEYMQGKGLIKYTAAMHDNLILMEKGLLACRNMVLKYNATSDTKILQQVQAYYDDLQVLDIDVCNNLIHII